MVPSVVELEIMGARPGADEVGTRSPDLSTSSSAVRVGWPRPSAANREAEKEPGDWRAGSVSVDDLGTGRRFWRGRSVSWSMASSCASTWSWSESPGRGVELDCGSVFMLRYWPDDREDGRSRDDGRESDEEDGQSVPYSRAVTGTMWSPSSVEELALDSLYRCRFRPGATLKTGEL